jgi:hypothetical protein
MRQLALIATIAGFIHGVASSDAPFPSLQHVAVAVTQLPVASWAEGIGNTAQMVFAKYTNTIPHYAGSRDTMYIASVPHKQVNATESRVLHEQAGRPHDLKTSCEPQMAIPDVWLAGGLLSVDVKNRSLTELLEDIGERCRIEVLGRDAVPDIPVSAKFDSVEVEGGIRRLMRIAGIGNYTLSHRQDSENHYIVTQIVVLPGEYKPSDRYQLPRATPRQFTASKDRQFTATWRTPKLKHRRNWRKKS